MGARAWSPCRLVVVAAWSWSVRGLRERVEKPTRWKIFRRGERRSRQKFRWETRRAFGTEIQEKASGSRELEPQYEMLLKGESGGLRSDFKMHK